jgi:very-short-patch-repair endonuclease
LKEAYVNEEKSTYQIAEEFNTYSNKILKALRFLNVEIRDYKAAQQVALKNGTSKQPTKGKKSSEETKKKLSAIKSLHWKNMSEEERERFSTLSKEQWQNMDPVKKDELMRLAAEAVRNASKEGSKAERFIVEELRKDGYEVIFHARDLIVNEKLEVDIFIPGLKTAIEIDGPSHFFPIWGEERLQKQQMSDAQKQGLLLNNGYCVLRIRQIEKNMSKKRFNDTLEVIREELLKIKNKFPSLKDRLIEIEVKDGARRVV